MQNYEKVVYYLNLLEKHNDYGFMLLLTYIFIFVLGGITVIILVSRKDFKRRRNFVFTLSLCIILIISVIFVGLKLKETKDEIKNELIKNQDIKAKCKAIETYVMMNNNCGMKDKELTLFFIHNCMKTD